MELKDKCDEKVCQKDEWIESALLYRRKKKSYQAGVQNKINKILAVLNGIIPFPSHWNKWSNPFQQEESVSIIYWHELIKL